MYIVEILLSVTFTLLLLIKSNNYLDFCYTLWCFCCCCCLGLPWWLSSKESARSAGDLGLTPELGRSLGGEQHNPLQYSCLENSMDRGAWQATIHGVTKSQTWLKWLSTQEATIRTSPVAQMVKNMPAVQEIQFAPGLGRFSEEENGLPTPAFLPGKSHGQRILAGYRVAKSQTQLSN